MPTRKLIKRTLAVAALAAAASASAALSAAGGGTVRHGLAAADATADVSSNWAGYVVTGPGSTAQVASTAMAFTDVTGRWVQPAARCVPGKRSSVALWVGLGGYSDNATALEQAGTSADCDADGNASYYAWYELVPADSVNVDLKIAPGDVITSSVVVDGTDVLVQIKNRTRGRSYTRHLAMDVPDLTSAEWIAEAPALCGDDGTCRQVPLTNFGSVVFSRTFARGNGTPGTISSPAWLASAIRLVPHTRRAYGTYDATSVGTAGAVAAGLAPDGAGFTVTWKPHPS